MSYSSNTVASRFSFHTPDQEGIEAMRSIRRKVRELAYEICRHCPDGHEKETALTQLSFVMMSANSSIVQVYPIDPKDT